MFTIFGAIPIRIHPFFWLLVAIISIFNGAGNLPMMIIWALIIVFSVIAHEFGHALTAKAFGQRVAIDLIGFGGMTSRQGPPLSLGKEFIIVANGPLAGLMVSAISYIIWLNFSHILPSLIREAIAITFTVNLFWTAVNLLPIQPLDGGHLTRIVLEALFGLRGVKAALFLSVLISALISVYLLLINFFLLGAFFMMFTFEGFRAWKESLLLANSDRDSDIQQLLKNAQKDFQKGHYNYALEKLNSLSKQTQKGVVFMTAMQLKAEILFQQGHLKEAYEILLPLKNSLNADSLQLLHELAFRTGEWREAIALGNAAYRHQPHYEVATINALCYAILGEVKPSVGWLQCAIKEGLPNLDELLNKREFDSIRSDPLFQNIAQRTEN